MTIAFTVWGKPATQGSKIAHAIYKNGRPVLKPNGTVLIVQRDSCKFLPEWRYAVRCAAREVYFGDPMEGDFALSITFALKRPKNQYRTGKYSKLLKPDAPPRPIVRPDTLKMARAVEDALSDLIYTDDSCITHHSLWKEYVHSWEDEYAAVEISHHEPDED